MKPEDKAWNYLRELLNDDERFFSFRTEGKPLEIDGSEGGKYFLYPTGKLARIDKEQPFLGALVASREMPLPDFFSALYVWITRREKEFQENWGCGNVSLSYHKGRLVTDGGRVADVREVPQGEFGASMYVGVDVGATCSVVAGAAYLVPEQVYNVLFDATDSGFVRTERGGEDTDGEH